MSNGIGGCAKGYPENVCGKFIALPLFCKSGFLLETSKERTLFADSTSFIPSLGTEPMIRELDWPCGNSYLSRAISAGILI